MAAQSSRCVGNSIGCVGGNAIQINERTWRSLGLSPAAVRKGFAFPARQLHFLLPHAPAPIKRGRRVEEGYGWLRPTERRSLSA